MNKSFFKKVKDLAKKILRIKNKDKIIELPNVSLPEEGIEEDFNEIQVINNCDVLLNSNMYKKMIRDVLDGKLDYKGENNG